MPLQIVALLESLEIIPGCVASVSFWAPHSLGIQTPGLLQQRRMDIVFQNSDIGGTSFVSAITQELPLPDQKAQYMIPHTLPWGGWMDESDTRDGALTAEWERASHRVPERERKAILRGKLDCMVST